MKLDYDGFISKSGDENEHRALLEMARLIKSAGVERNEK